MDAAATATSSQIAEAPIAKAYPTAAGGVPAAVPPIKGLRLRAPKHKQGEAAGVFEPPDLAETERFAQDEAFCQNDAYIAGPGSHHHDVAARPPRGHHSISGELCEPREPSYQRDTHEDEPSEPQRCTSTASSASSRLAIGTLDSSMLPRSKTMADFRTSSAVPSSAATLRSACARAVASTMPEPTPHASQTVSETELEPQEPRCPPDPQQPTGSDPPELSTPVKQSWQPLSTSTPKYAWQRDGCEALIETRRHELLELEIQDDVALIREWVALTRVRSATTDNNGRAAFTTRGVSLSARSLDLSAAGTSPPEPKRKFWTAAAAGAFGLLKTAFNVTTTAPTATTTTRSPLDPGKKKLLPRSRASTSIGPGSDTGAKPATSFTHGPRVAESKTIPKHNPNELNFDGTKKKWSPRAVLSLVGRLRSTGDPRPASLLQSQLPETEFDVKPTKTLQRGRLRRVRNVMSAKPKPTKKNVAANLLRRYEFEYAAPMVKPTAAIAAVDYSKVQRLRPSGTFSHALSRLYTTPQARCGVLYLEPVLIGY